jgi:membrane-bound ClpP family serine protease
MSGSAKIRTIQDLNQRVWYRFLKVVYISAALITIGLSFFIIKFFSHGYLFFFYVAFVSLVIGLIFELILRIFYYIVTGTFVPSDKNPRS